ncbi:SAV_915 family protein [Plantactinospora endophytica]|uniref:Response regulatory domain-containing protein n=1 Tax=Plantactinospora endophytica TaxID=673535 RepID=A0ABQ4DXH7_9ACTN|nr:SAV_915 family protein [Plantactinospora endophytica]GIG87159.1 hypothetical protein Pen02_20950 [Plantactinospora endophytica]
MAPAPVIPPVVYLACEEASSESFRPDLHATGDEQVAVLVYTALDRLIECCGPEQPWVVVSTSAFDAIEAYAPFDVVLVDAEIPEVHRRRAG